MDRPDNKNKDKEDQIDRSVKFNHFKGKKPIKTIKGFVEEIRLDEINQEIEEDYGRFN